jgi:hypothetical protein
MSAEGGNATTNPYSRNVNHRDQNLWRSTAKPLFDRVMADIGGFDGIAFDDLRGDNAIDIISTFVNRLVESPPHSNRTGKPYGTKTLENSFRKILEMFNQKFSRQAQDAGDLLFPPTEVNSLLKRIRDGHHRTMMEGEDENDTFKNIFPIPPKHGMRTRIHPDDDFPTEPMRTAARQTDLYNLCKKLFQTARFTELAKLLITFKAIGRGGEVKFLSYKRMFFDEQFNCLFTQWFQRKNLKSNPSGFTVDFGHPETCVFLALGCYWACDNGLHREHVGHPGTPMARRNAFVFQDLHNIQDGSVASQLTSTIRSLIIPSLKNYYTVKSLRIGAMTTLAWDPSVTYDESVALGGWSTASNSDWYTWMYIVAIIPPILCLAGYSQPRRIPHLPHNGCLFYVVSVEHRFTADKWTSLLDRLFPNNLPEFSAPHGRLRRFMDCVACVMLMHFTHFYNRLGHSHPYCRTMIGAVKRAQIATTDTMAIEKLNLWSKCLEDDYRNGNPQRQDEVILQNDTRSKLDALTNEVATLRSQSLELEQHMATQQSQHLHFVNIIGNLTNQNQRLLEQQELMMQNHADLLQKISGLFNSNSTITVSPVQPERADEIVNDASEPTANNNYPEDTPSPANQQLTAAPQQRATPPVRQLATTFVLPHAQPPASRQRGKRDGRETIEQIFNAMYKESEEKGTGPFHSLRSAGPQLDHQTTWIVQTIFNGNPKAFSKVRRAMEFIDCIWTAEERDEIINMRHSRYLDACRVHERLAKRLKKVLYFLLPTAKEAKGPTRMNTAVQGVANNVNKALRHHGISKIEDYIQDWGNGGAIKAEESLTMISDRRRMELCNPYRNN